LLRRLRTSPRMAEIDQMSKSRLSRAASFPYQKKVSTWNYKVLSFSCFSLLSPRCSLLVSLIICLTTDDLHGIAEFRPGESEPAEVPIVDTSAPKVPTIVEPVSDVVVKESFSLMQKGLFFLVILGCVAAYLRMGGKKEKRFEEKSMA